MEIRELKSRIRSLVKAYQKMQNMPFYEHHEKDAFYVVKEKLIKELQDIYNANTDFVGFTKNEILSLIKLNLHIRAIQLHTFGSDINLNKLIL